MTMGSYPGSQGLSMYTPYLQWRPPSTQLTSLTGQDEIAPFTPRHLRNLSFQEDIHWHLTFNEMPLLTPETDTEDGEETLLTADLDGPVWDKDPVPDSRKYICIHEIPRLASPTQTQQPIPLTPPLQPDHGFPAMPLQQPDQVEMSPEIELMEQDIPEDIPDLLDVLKEVMSDFDAWAHNILSYQIW